MKFDHLDIQITKVTENSMESHMFFSKDCGFFEGHFLDFPILPGLFQVHLAIKLSEKHFLDSYLFKGFSNIKYFKPIFPESRIYLTTEYKRENSNLFFQYSDSSTVYSKGSCMVVCE